MTAEHPPQYIDIGLTALLGTMLSGPANYTYEGAVNDVPVKGSGYSEAYLAAMVELLLDRAFAAEVLVGSKTEGLIQVSASHCNHPSRSRLWTGTC